MPDTAAVSSMLDRVADDLLTERQAAELLGWKYPRLKMRRLKSYGWPGHDNTPAHIMAGPRPLYLRAEVERWRDAHPEFFCEDLLDKDEVAEATGFTVRQLRDMRERWKADPASDAHPPFVIVGNKAMVKASDLEAWVLRRLHRKFEEQGHDPPGDPTPKPAAAKGSKRKSSKRRR